MEKTISKPSSCLRDIEITATEQDMKPIYDKTLEKYSKNLNLPGFRKGKAPISMILKMYGKEIQEDFKEECINEFTRQILVEEKINPISRAKVLHEDFKKGESYNFKVQFEVMPDIELKQYKGLEIEKIIYHVHDHDIDAELKRIIDSNRQFEDAEKAVDENYVVTADVQELDQAGVAIIGSKSENVPIPLNEPTVAEGLKKSLLNTSVGDTVNVNLEPPKDSKDKPFHAGLTVKRIQKIILPELDESLIKKVTRDKISNLDDLKKEIRSNLEKQSEMLTENVFRANLEQELIRKNEFDVPDTMIENYLDEMVEGLRNNYPNKVFPSDFDVASYRERNRVYAIMKIKTYFIYQKIAELENLKVDDVDIALHAESESTRTGISKDRLINYYKSSNDVKDKLLGKKLEDFLKSNNKIIEKEHKHEDENTKIVTE